MRNKCLWITTRHSCLFVDDYIHVQLKALVFFPVGEHQHTSVCHQFKLHEPDPEMERKCNLEIDSLFHSHKTSCESKMTSSKEVEIFWTVSARKCQFPPMAEVIMIFAANCTGCTAAHALLLWFLLFLSKNNVSSVKTAMLTIWKFQCILYDFSTVCITPLEYYLLLYTIYHPKITGKHYFLYYYFCVSRKIKTWCNFEIPSSTQ